MATNLLMQVRHVTPPSTLCRYWVRSLQTSFRDAKTDHRRSQRRRGSASKPPRTAAPFSNLIGVSRSVTPRTPRPLMSSSAPPPRHTFHVGDLCSPCCFLHDSVHHWKLGDETGRGRHYLPSRRNVMMKSWRWCSTMTAAAWSSVGDRSVNRWRISPTHPTFDVRGQRIRIVPSIRSVSKSAFRDNTGDIGDRRIGADYGWDDNHDLVSEGAEEAYRKYLEVDERAQELRSQWDHDRSIELFRAWERAVQQHNHHQGDGVGPASAGRSSKASRRAPGVAVVKTLVRQANGEKGDDGPHDGLIPRRKVEELEERAERLLERAALQHGHPEALLRLGNRFFEQGSPADARRAVELWKRSGTGAGWFNVGHVLWTGYNRERLPSGAAPRIANREPNHELGVNDRKNDDAGIDASIPANREEAMHAFERAVEMGDVDAMYFIGVHRLSSIDKKEGDSARSTEQRSSSCKTADLATNVASTSLSLMRSGLAYLEQAAEQGHGPAMHYLALLHLQGHEQLGIPSVRDETFASELNLACDVGENPDSWYLRGHCHLRGEHSFPRSSRLALDDFLRAADAGHADAAVSAGALCFRGGDDGQVARNPRRAFELYQHAGELGSVEGWRNVVACYATGQGVPQSFETAKYVARTMLPTEEAY